MQTTEPRKRKRTSNACVPCRQSKIKCSGEAPCANCRRRFVHCRFAESERRISGVNRRGFGIIAHPATDVRTQQQSPPQYPWAGSVSSESTHEPSSGVSGDENAHGNAHDIWTSPFTLPSTVIVENTSNRKWIWLAPSSMWSFTARLTVMLDQKLNLNPERSPYKAPAFDDDDIYPVRWKVGSAVDGNPDVSDLPSSEEARYLFNTVKFHLGQIYPLLDEKFFTTGMDKFYGEKPIGEMPEPPRLWFIQYFLVLSFGRAFLSRSKVPGEPPGWKYFSRAMSLMPDRAILARDILVSIEILGLSALYLYSIEHRESAQLFVCQAIRLAQLEGLHTQLPESALGVETITRCRDLWWTLYIMDRHVSSSLGLPMTVQDDDITTILDGPYPSGQSNPTLNLQVRIARVHCFILSTIYKSERTQLSHFLGSTKSILHALAGHAREIEGIIHVNLEAHVETMPRGTRHITLLYHQCVIMATRPLLLSVLMELLENLSQGRDDWRNLLQQTKTLVSTGIKSASKTVQILSDEDSISAFLIFDLEFLYGAAIHLMMANAIFPDTTEAQPFQSQEVIHSLFDEMAHKGNRIAQVKKAQLVRLETSFQELAAKVKQQGLQAASLSDPSGAQAEAPVTASAEQRQSAGSNREYVQGGISPLHAQGMGPDVCMNAASPSDAMSSTIMDTQLGGVSIEPSLTGSVQTPNIEFLENIGISSDEFFRIVDQMAYPDTLAFGTFDP